MSATGQIERMIWSVANRYGFDAYDLKVSRLRSYYRGHVEMVREEQKAAEGK